MRDPLALALAAAVRWTSTDDEVTERGAQVQKLEPRGRTRSDAAGARPATEPRGESSPARSDAQKRNDGVIALPGEPRGGLAERAPSLRIGSVEVQVVPVIQGPPSGDRSPAEGQKTESSAPLSRELTSHIGLRQG